MAVGDKRPVLMEADKGVPDGVAALDAAGMVIGAFPKGGYGTLPDGTDLKTMPDGGNNYYTLRDGYTYKNAPEGFAGWGMLLVLDKVAILFPYNIPAVYCSVNLYTSNPAWATFYTTTNLTALRDALKAIW